MIKKPSVEQASSTVRCLPFRGAIQEGSDIDDRNGVHLLNSLTPISHRLDIIGPA
jgi:hypothetical protein